MKLYSRLRCSLKYVYDVPEDYHNSFYNANASLFQTVNYFVHKSYKLLFPELLNKVEDSHPSLSEDAAIDTLRECIRRMEFCDQTVELKLPVMRKHGSYEIVKGLRIYHGLMPFKNFAMGSFRLIENFRRHDMQGFAVLATYRNACYGLDVAGAHGGLKLNADLYEPDERKAVLQMYTDRMLPHYGVVDIYQSDRHCDSAEMGVMYERCSSDTHIYAAGRPIAMGGLNCFTNCGANGVMAVLKMFLNNKNIMDRIGFGGFLHDKTFIIQGLGKMGRELATQMSAAGATCVGVRDLDCIIYDTSGISVKALLKHRRKYGNILNFSRKGKETECDSIFWELCDILILSANEKAIHCHVADRMKAKILVEACNGSIMPTSDRILRRKSKLIIPSILAVGGPSVMSYLEYIYREDEPDIKEVKIIAMYEKIIKETVEQVFQVEQELQLNLDFRAACYAKGIRRLFNRLVDIDLPIKESIAEPAATGILLDESNITN